MATSLGYSMINEIVEHETNPKEYMDRKRNVSKGPDVASNVKVDTLMKHIYASENQENELADFYPPDDVESSIKVGLETFESRSPHTNDLEKNLMDQNENCRRNYTTFGEDQSRNKNYETNPILMEKLSYLIKLIEKNNDEKINSSTEELLLYFFLGVFVIFAVDSFVRVGKYVR